MKTHLILLAGLLAWNAEPARSAETAPRPHIIFFLADDLGWTDVSYHGDEIRTPHIDKLAAAGARLESFYVQPVCSPTRAALLTGRYPMRYGLQVGVVRPWAEYGLPLDERTLAQALKEAGYVTAMSGKWHLGHFQRAYLPTQRGFDHQYGHYNGALDYFTHARDGGHDWHRNDRDNRDEGYATVLIGREAVRWIEGHDPRRPLFLYVPFNAPHTPLQALPEDLERYAHMADPRRRAYAAMVHAMDEQIGKVVEAIERRGMTGNTLFIFSSDNGGPTGQAGTNGKLRAGKGTLYEGGVRVTACAAWRGKIKPGTVIEEPLHIVDWYPTLVKLAGGSLRQDKPLDGKDLWPVLTEGKPSPHEEILLNVTPSNGAIRMGKWKLVVNGSRRENGTEALGSRDRRGAGDDQFELFDLSKDLFEQENLALTHPEKVKELRGRLEEYARNAAPPKSAPKAPDFKSPRVWGESE